MGPDLKTVDSVAIACSIARRPPNDDYQMFYPPPPIPRLRWPDVFRQGAFGPGGTWRMPGNGGMYASSGGAPAEHPQHPPPQFMFPQYSMPAQYGMPPQLMPPNCCGVDMPQYAMFLQQVVCVFVGGGHGSVFGSRQ